MFWVAVAVTSILVSTGESASVQAAIQAPLPLWSLHSRFYKEYTQYLPSMDSRTGARGASHSEIRIIKIIELSYYSALWFPIVII